MKIILTIKIAKNKVKWELPKILIICLNRFDNNNNKLNTHISFDSILNLKKYTVLKDNSKYELYSICNHYGITNGGHYTSVCKKNNKWYEYDDAKVLLIDEKNIFTENAYCLFYKKI